MAPKFVCLISGFSIKKCGLSEGFTSLYLFCYNFLASRGFTIIFRKKELCSILHLPQYASLRPASPCFALLGSASPSHCPALTLSSPCFALPSLCFVLLRPALPCFALLCSLHPALPCLALLCPALPCFARFILLCPALPYLLSST